MFPSKNKPVAFVRVGPKRSLLGDVLEARRGLITGLQSAETEKGWSDPSGEKAQMFWTAIEVCKALIDAGVPTKNLDVVLSATIERKLSRDNLIGWDSESAPGLISAYVTRDIGLLYLSLGKSGELAEVLDTFEHMQNPDGGWGVCSGDIDSRTRATGAILRLYGEYLQSPWAYKLVNMQSCVKGVRWLDIAQNGDGGWGNLGNTQPSDLSATAIALNALLSIKLAAHKHPNLPIPVHDKTITSGIARLVKFGQSGGWRGQIEECGVQIAGETTPRRFISGGVGTLFVTQVFAKSIRLGYLSAEDHHFLEAVSDVLNRCQEYATLPGKWIVPSDQGGPPTAWNSAFAIEALIEAEKTYMELIRRGMIDRRIIEAAYAQAKRWKHISIVVVSFLLIVLLVPRLSFLNSVVAWFNAQPPWTQGIVMIFITLAVERLISIAGSIVKPLVEKLREDALTSDD